jgi:hypothetical protein
MVKGKENNVKDKDLTPKQFDIVNVLQHFINLSYTNCRKYPTYKINYLFYIVYYDRESQTICENGTESQRVSYRKQRFFHP